MTLFPGFDGLRLLAAVCVLFSHAFIIATGSESDEPFVRLLGHGNIAGLYGVYTFFIISGFLLAHSLGRDASLARFALNRTLRIYPGFIACTLVTALILGPLGSRLAAGQYFGDPSVIDFVTTAVYCVCSIPTLPGVYAYPGPDIVTSVVNGSLWSLRFEVLSYLLLAWLWLVLRNVRATAIVLALLAAATVAFPVVYAGLPSVNFTLPYFAGGVLMYAVYLRFGLHMRLAVLCLAALLLAAVAGIQALAYAIFGSYVIACLGTRPNPGSAIAARVGDLSYGVYLYGWPVEQLVKQYAGVDNPWLLVGMALPPTLALAAVSFHLVERPMLRLKEPLARFTRRTPAIADPLLRRAAGRAAAIVFLAAGVLFLTAEKIWWYVTPGLVVIVATSVIAALIAAFAAGTWQRLRRQA